MQEFMFDYLDENVLEFRFDKEEQISAFAIWNLFTKTENGIKQVIVNYGNDK